MIYDISIFGITSIYLHTFSVSTLFSHYVFGFVSNWLCGFYERNSDVSVSYVLCGYHIQGQVSREASRAVSRMSSRLSVKSSGSKVQKLGN